MPNQEARAEAGGREWRVVSADNNHILVHRVPIAQPQPAASPVEMPHAASEAVIHGCDGFGNPVTYRLGSGNPQGSTLEAASPVREGESETQAELRVVRSQLQYWRTMASISANSRVSLAVEDFDFDWRNQPTAVAMAPAPKEPASPAVRTESAARGEWPVENNPEAFIAALLYRQERGLTPTREQLQWLASMTTTRIQQDAQTIARLNYQLGQQEQQVKENVESRLHAESDLAEANQTIEAQRESLNIITEQNYKAHTDLGDTNRTIEKLQQQLADAQRCIKGWEEGNIEWQKVQAERDVLKRELEQERRIRDNRANRVRQAALEWMRQYEHFADKALFVPYAAFRVLENALNEAAQPAADEAPTDNDPRLTLSYFRTYTGRLDDVIDRLSEDLAKVTQERDDLKERLEGLIRAVWNIARGRYISLDYHNALMDACKKAESPTSPSPVGKE